MVKLVSIFCVCFSTAGAATVSTIHAEREPVPHLPYDQHDFLSPDLELTVDGKGFLGDTISYDGNEHTVKITVIDKLQNNSEILVTPTVNEYHDMTGPDVKKTLIKEEYDEEKLTDNNTLDYSREDDQISFRTLVPFALVARRLNMPYCEGAIDIVNGIEFDINNYEKEKYTLDVLKKYACARDFVEGENFRRSTAQYTENLGSEEFVKGLQIYAENNNDLAKTLEALRKEDGGAGVRPRMDPVYYYTMRVKKSSPAAQKMLAWRQRPGYNPFPLIEENDEYVFHIHKYLGVPKDMVEENMYAYYDCKDAADEAGITSSDYTYSCDPEQEKNYEVYYNFTKKDAVDAWADEVDVWSGRWDYFLYGGEHFDYYPDYEKSYDWPGYENGNWGNFHFINDKRTYHHYAEYQYTIKDPGTYTITVNGVGQYKGSFSKTFTISTESTGKLSMYRLYNPNSGEHFYTKDSNERSHLISVGWKYEGVGWMAPSTSSTPVYRVYNPNAGDHHYTMDANEKDSLVAVGWIYEGIGWFSDDAKTIPLYRQYNPNAVAGAHNYTVNANERDMLISAGWNDEGIGWYGY